MVLQRSIGGIECLSVVMNNEEKIEAANTRNGAMEAVLVSSLLYKTIQLNSVFMFL